MATKLKLRLYDVSDLFCGSMVLVDDAEHKNYRRGGDGDRDRDGDGDSGCVCAICTCLQVGWGWSVCASARGWACAHVRTCVL